jgi:hypothetical protein
MTELTKEASYEIWLRRPAIPVLAKNPEYTLVCEHLNPEKDERVYPELATTAGTDPVALDSNVMMRLCENCLTAYKVADDARRRSRILLKVVTASPSDAREQLKKLFSRTAKDHGALGVGVLEDEDKMMFEVSFAAHDPEKARSFQETCEGNPYLKIVNN